MNGAQLDEAEQRLIITNPHAAMITIGADNRPKAAKIEVSVVDGRLESVSHADKVRTRRLQRDGRCTLYFADNEHRWLALEVDVTIIGGPQAPDRLLRFFRSKEGRSCEPIDYHSDRGHHVGLGDDAFRHVVAAENAVLYEFGVTKSYGNS